MALIKSALIGVKALGIMTVLAGKGLVTVSINVVNSLYYYKFVSITYRIPTTCLYPHFVSCRSGVYADSSCNTYARSRHAIVIVGYGTLNGVKYWVCVH